MTKRRTKQEKVETLLEVRSYILMGYTQAEALRRANCNYMSFQRWQRDPEVMELQAEREKEMEQSQRSFGPQRVTALTAWDYVLKDAPLGSLGNNIECFTWDRQGNPDLSNLPGPHIWEHTLKTLHGLRFSLWLPDGTVQELLQFLHMARFSLYIQNAEKFQFHALMCTDPEPELMVGLEELVPSNKLKFPRPEGVPLYSGYFAFTEPYVLPPLKSWKLRLYLDESPAERKGFLMVGVDMQVLEDLTPG